MIYKLNCLSIIVPLPDRRLHAHNKGHWSAKSAATKTARRAGYLATLDKLGGADAPYWERAKLYIELFFVDRRVRDALNIVQGLKPVIDGVVDAGLIKDDNWTCLHMTNIRSSLTLGDPHAKLTFFKDHLPADLE